MDDNMTMITEFFKKEGLSSESSEVLLCLMIHPSTECPKYYFTGFETELEKVISEGFIRIENETVYPTDKSKSLITRVAGMMRLIQNTSSTSVH